MSLTSNVQFSIKEFQIVRERMKIDNLVNTWILTSKLYIILIINKFYNFIFLLQRQRSSKENVCCDGYERDDRYHYS